MIDRAIGRLKRHRRLRKRIMGVADKPRLNVHRSLKHLYVQLIDDMGNRTMVGVSTKTSLPSGTKHGGNIAAAETLGRIIAEQAIKQGIKRVVFDRGGYQYHGRVKALAEAARKAGLEF